MWLRSQDPPYHWDDSCEGAASNGHLATLKWLRSEGCPWNKAECVRAAEEEGHTHIVQWIDEQEEVSEMD